MKKALFLFLLSASVAQAGVEGTYICRHYEKVSVKGAAGSATRNVSETTQLTLNSDGSALATNPALPGKILPGTWSISGRKIFLNPDYNLQAQWLVEGCELAGAHCVFAGSTSRYNMTLNKAQTGFGGTNKHNTSLIVNGDFRTINTTDRVTCNK